MEEHNNQSSTHQAPDDRPVPVVRVLSVRGVEYGMMTFMLWFAAVSLIWILVSLVQGGSSASFASQSFPLAMLLVSVPVFAFFFLRLRRAELANPALRHEASKRRFSQLTQFVAFFTCFFNVVALVYTLVGIAGGTEVDSVGKLIGSTAIILAVAGGILAYYWADEHKMTRR